jgi:hypothetical protein
MPHSRRDRPTLRPLTANTPANARYPLTVILEHALLDEDQAVAVLDTLHDIDSWEELLAFVIYAFAQHALIWRDRAEMLLRITDRPQTSGLGFGDGIGEPLLTAATVDLFLASRQGNQARAALLRNHRSHPAITVGAARLELLSGNPTSALTEVARALTEPDDNPRIELEALLIRTAAQAQLGMDGSTAFRTAVELGYHHQLLRPFLTLPRPLLEDLAARTRQGTWLVGLHALMQSPETFPDHVYIVELTIQETARPRTVDHRSPPPLHRGEAVRLSRDGQDPPEGALPKLDVDGREEAVAKGYEWGLI